MRLNLNLTWEGSDIDNGDILTFFFKFNADIAILNTTDGISNKLFAVNEGI